jgi:Amt family ammonium transporter
LKKPISLFVWPCNREKGKYYKTFRTSQRFDAGSVSNGILAGLVAVTAACDAVEPWAAVVIGLIGGILYSLWIRLITELYIDDPIEASGVHYVNGVWGILACIIFDSQKGFISGNPEMGKYLGVQVYGIICVTLWSMAWALAFFLPCRWLGVLKYHPVIEMLGVHRFKMGDLTEAFLTEIRQFSKKHDDFEIESGPYLQEDAKKATPNSDDNGYASSKSSKVDEIP